MRAHALQIAALLFALMCACVTAQAAPLDDARALLRKGEHAQALQQVDLLLSTNPEDTQARFLKGVILTEQGNTEGAIQVFRALTREYPELPEPYNNLAVLYAGRGDYRSARDALDMAVRVKPDYATAYENLGDIHVLLASQAYEKALSLDNANRSARGKLTLARELAAYAPPAPKAAP
jgi:Flp pilus assembly protein TadD